MDKKRIIGEVAARHGVRLDEDDPVLILITIAELTLEQSSQQLINTVRDVTSRLERAMRKREELMQDLRCDFDVAERSKPSILNQWLRSPPRCAIALLVVAITAFTAGLLVGLSIVGTRTLTVF